MFCFLCLNLCKDSIEMSSQSRSLPMESSNKKQNRISLLWSSVFRFLVWKTVYTQINTSNDPIHCDFKLWTGRMFIEQTFFWSKMNSAETSQLSSILKTQFICAISAETFFWWKNIFSANFTVGRGYVQPNILRSLVEKKKLTFFCNFFSWVVCFPVFLFCVLLLYFRFLEELFFSWWPICSHG